MWLLFVGACADLRVAADAGEAREASTDSALDDACARDYPAGPYGTAIGEILPPLELDGERAGGFYERVRLASLHQPCATSALLILRLGAGFCRPCIWHARNDALADAMDVMATDRDNFPATLPGLSAYRAAIGAGGVIAGDRALELFRAREPLPVYVLVDRASMRVVDRVSNPAPEVLDARVRRARGERVGEPVVALFDGVFTSDEWALLREITLPGAPPPDPTNARADDAAAAALGETLFFDAALSPSNRVSCASCHDEKLGYGDGKPQSEGLARADRNAPSVLLAAHARWQFWDGRADTLWMQAAAPIEDAKEMGSSRLFVAHHIESAHAAAYEAVWGKLPPLAQLPPHGKPGDASYGALTALDQQRVTRVLVNVSKSIAAYERSLRAKPNRLDAYVSGDLGALSVAEKQGLAVFFRAGCAQCHGGPRLTDDAFHNTRFPTGRKDGAPDPGWRDGILRLLQSELHAASPYSDAPKSTFGVLAPTTFTLGTMKTPSLRGLPRTAPYGHGGTLTTLKDVLDLYGEPGLPADDPRAVGPVEPWLPRVLAEERAALLPLLELLE